MRTLCAAVVTAVAALGVGGCMPARSNIVQPNPNFTWEPPTKEPSRSINVALVSPTYGAESKLGSYAANKYSEMFLQSLQADLDRILLAKGFTVTGPFRSLDDMTFPEKKAAPLALVPEVIVVLNEVYSENRNDPGAFGSHRIRRQGTLTASTLAKFAMIEPMSAQKIWLKKIDVPQVTSSIDVDLLTDASGRPNPYHGNRDNGDAAVVDALNKAYQEILHRFWAYLDAEEIRGMKKAADEVRSRKVY